MALSHKDWELPNSRFWLAEMDVDRGLARFPHLERHLDRQCFKVKKSRTKMQNHWLFSPGNIYFCKYQKADEKKNQVDEQTLEELNLAHRRSQAKCQLVNGVWHLQTADYRLQTADCRLQTADYRLQITGYRLQITDYRLQITVCIQWTSDRRL